MQDPSYGRKSTRNRSAKKSLERIEPGSSLSGDNHESLSSKHQLNQLRQNDEVVNEKTPIDLESENIELK